MDEERIQEIEDMLRENLRIARENNHILHKLWRAEVMTFWSRILLYVVLIGIPVVIYQYYLAGYVDQFKDGYQNLRGTLEDIRHFESLPAAVLHEFTTKTGAIE